MAKDKVFKLRLDDKDRRRLDAVAEHLSAPAATAIRMIIKEKYDNILGLLDGNAKPVKPAKATKKGVKS